MRWKGKPRCHQCGNNKNNYKYTSRPIYKCVNCGTQFRATTGTIFQDSKLPLSHWFYAIRQVTCKKKGISSYDLAIDLGITQKSAWYMESNIRIMMGNRVHQKMLGEIVEIDEMYAVRDVTKKTKQGHGTNKQKILGMRQRNSEKKKGGELRTEIVEKVTSKVLHPIIGLNVEEGTMVITDEWKAYRNLEHKYKRGVVNHSKRQYVDGDIHTNSIEGVWSHIRKFISGIHHRPTPEHLRKYLDEFEFRFNNRTKSLEGRFNEAIKQCGVRTKHSEIKKNLRPLAGKKRK